MCELRVPEVSIGYTSEVSIGYLSEWSIEYANTWHACPERG